MKEKLKLIAKSRLFWAGVGSIAGAIYPPIGQIVNLLSNVLLGGGLV